MPGKYLLYVDVAKSVAHRRRATVSTARRYRFDTGRAETQAGGMCEGGAQSSGKAATQSMRQTLIRMLLLEIAVGRARIAVARPDVALFFEGW